MGARVATTERLMAKQVPHRPIVPERGMKTTSLAALALATQITLEITSAPRAAGLWWP